MNSHLVWLTEHDRGTCAPLPREPNPPSCKRSLTFLYLFLVHPSPTLINHPCPYLSAHPISHFFWRSVSCCGSHRTVQESHSHQWGQDVSWGYLIQRGKLLLGLLFYHAPMTDPLGSESPLGSSRGLPLAMWCLPLLRFWSAEDRVVLSSVS